jgi:hypothetical protein
MFFDACRQEAEVSANPLDKDTPCPRPVTPPSVGRLSPFQKSAVCITVTTASPRSRCAVSIAATVDRTNPSGQRVFVTVNHCRTFTISKAVFGVQRRLAFDLTPATFSAET